MRNTEWQKVEDVFNTALNLKFEDRGEYLKSIETNEREIYGEVISLLSADELGDVLPNSQASFDFLTNENRAAADTSQYDVFDANQEISLVGETIGERYKIIKQLGSGGMGDVFLAQDRNVMNRETVVKLLKSEILANPEVVRKFKHEIEALARLKDPGIVTILDSGLYGKQPFLVLEFIEGEDLALIISPILFSIRDFINSSDFAVRLSARNSKVTDHIWRSLSSEAQAKLSDDNPEAESPAILRDEFNKLLADANLYQGEIFDDADASIITRISGDNDNYTDLLKSNRLLLESTFPDDIVAGGNKKLSVKDAAVIFRQLGESLSHGHHKGIIHRDLKPANIMITQNERGDIRTKLIDFGVAKVRESLVAPSTEVGLSFGTRKYMSPEQVNGERNLTPATDVYALGLIAFESLTGQHIFRTDSFIEQCRMQETEEFSEITDIRPELSPKVKEIICRALSFKSENRQQTAAEFGNSLADALLVSSSAQAKTHTEPIIRTGEKTEILTAPENFKLDEINTSNRKNTGKIIPVAVGLALILILLSLTGWLIRHNISEKTEGGQTNVATPESVKRELNYKLTVQKYYEGKPFQKPFEATGDEVFGDDWRFKMVMDSPQNGNLYLLSENQKTKNLTMLFPHPQRNDGKSAVVANEKIDTAEMMFDKNQGAEKFWIVWADKPVAELEAVTSFVNPQDLGKIKDSDKESAVRAFLEREIAGEKLTEKTADDKQSKKLMTTSDILVKMAEFRHN